MSSTYSPAPSDCGSVEIATDNCDCSTRTQHTNRRCLTISPVDYNHMAAIAPLTPQSSPIRRRPEEAILMDDLRKTREEMRRLREELRKTQDERDKSKNRNHGMLAECYEIIKQHRLESELSLTTLQYLDTPAAVKRLEAHDQHMHALFARGSCDLAATVQNIILEIQFVKTTMGGDTLQWRLYSALNLMQHISKKIQKTLSRTRQVAAIGPKHSEAICDDYLSSTLKSADVQLLSTLNEVRERGLNDYFQAFRERFAPEYDLVRNECAQDFYEKTKALMIHMYSQRRMVVVPEFRLNEVDPIGDRREEEDEQKHVLETTWI